ncbi:Eco57I restriction-modification methylase domain-containing protein, partial [Macrococcoides bohemicum]|uniref:Eco57I restriction-modification methylase domain-containing protein n=1 Tax=Macrococcoides bohemicum TaxID=1903056 RepID=UPI00165DA25B
KLDNLDIIIVNPPWEKIRFEERKFLKSFNSNIADIPKKKNRELAIEELRTHNKLNYEYYLKVKNDYKESKVYLKKNNYLNYSLSGELNTYSIFYELGINLLNKKGVIGLFVKSSFVKTPSNQKIFNHILHNNYLESIDLFSNYEKIFPIDTREEFAYVISSINKNKNFTIRSNLRNIKDFKEVEPIILDQNDILVMNQQTSMLPNFNNQSEINFLVKMHKENNIFHNVFPNVKFGRLVHLTSHSEYISTNKEDGLPIYEGKFIERYDSMYSTFKNISNSDMYKSKANALVQKEFKDVPVSRYFIDQDFWFKISKNYNDDFTILWRSLTSTSNRRTMLATVLPFLPTSQSIQFLQANSKKETILILALFNSIIFDYLVRLKMPGIDLTQTVVKSIPVPELHIFEKIIIFNNEKNTIYNHIQNRVSWLYRNDERLNKLFEDNSYSCINQKICEVELDRLIALSYGIENDILKKIASNFNLFYDTKELDLFF